MAADGRRRRLGLVLMVWGVVGLAVLGTALGFVNGALSGSGGPIGLDNQRQQLVLLLDASADALEGARNAAATADDSLVSAGGAAGSAASFMQELSGTMTELATSLRISILGSQPFAAPADDMDRVAASAARVAADLDVAATGIRLGGEDMAVLAGELEEMQQEVRTLREGLGGTIDTRGWQLLATVVLAWLAVPAVISLVVGFSWWRLGDRRPSVSDPDGRVSRARSPIAHGD
jgi:hypothetical protein